MARVKGGFTTRRRRKKVLKLDKVHSYDMFVPMVKAVDNNINYDELEEIMRDKM